MAKIKLNYLSSVLKMQVDVVVVLPNDQLEYVNLTYLPSKEKYKTLYLLHGMYGDCNDWTNNTRIQLWANEYNVAVVMPTGLNNFYIDAYDGSGDYGKFIGEELIEYTRKTFPLSDKREDTFIAGLSMGGYGALRNGLKYHDVFSHIIALSPVTQRANKPYNKDTDLVDMERLFGPYEYAKNSENNLENLLLSINKEDLPAINFAIGTEDFLYEDNQAFKKFLIDHDIKFNYYEEHGEHYWDFWDRNIKRFLDYLPLK